MGDVNQKRKGRMKWKIRGRQKGEQGEKSWFLLRHKGGGGRKEALWGSGGQAAGRSEGVLESPPRIGCAKISRGKGGVDQGGGRGAHVGTQRTGERGGEWLGKGRRRRTDGNLCEKKN